MANRGRPAQFVKTAPRATCLRSSTSDSKRGNGFASKVRAPADTVESRNVMTTPDLAAHYLEEVRKQFRGHKRLGEGAMAQLKDEEFFTTLDPESNSVAVLVKHLA